MLEKIDHWFRKPMKYPIYFYMSIVLLFLSCIGGCLLVRLYDSDSYFIIDTGREILANGIFHENPWSCVSGMNFVSQQWLYCVIVAFMFDTCGEIGMFFVIFTQMVVYFILAYLYLREHDVQPFFAIFITIIIAFMTQPYYINPRPETLTIVLFLLLAMCLEKYINTGNKLWLIGIPVLNIIEMNVHASMWLFHYAIIVAYLVPAFYWPQVDDKSMKSRRLPIIATALISLPCLFINPYGLDNVLYLVNTYRAHVFNWIDVLELKQVSLMSVFGLAIILMLVALVIATKFKTVRSVTVNMVLGMGLLMSLAVRNSMFFMFAGLYAFGDLFSIEHIKNLKINWRKDLNNAVFIALLIANVFFLGMLFTRIPYIDGGLSGNVEDSVAYTRNMNTVADYLDEYAEPGVKIMTGFNIGAYLEFRGYRNLYIDARPECYSDVFTKDGNNLLAEYSIYCQYGVVASTGTKDTIYPHYAIDKEAMEAWLDKYDFDYIIVYAGSDCYLQGYMQGCSRYVPAYESKGKVHEPYLIFEKASRIYKRKDFAVVNGK